MAEAIIQIKSLPGIKRDGTKLEGDQYVDGQWCRFQRNLPRKIGGYRSINKYLQGPSRALFEYTANGLTYVHSGAANAVERLYIDSANNSSIITNRTPTSLVEDDQNVWTFDTDGKLVGGINNQLLIAQVAPNLSSLSNTDGGQLFYGDLLGTAPLLPIALPVGGNASGGIVALHPYTFFFGNDGYIGWSIAGDPTDLSSTGSGALNAASQKIVRGMPLRGGPGNSPSGLFWSADALVRAAFIGGAPVFQFDTISTQTSIMSPRSVIEYDGVFYWLGEDRFLLFNGVVREIPNGINSNFIFDNLNYDQRQKVFAIKVPRFGEIWWCFPFGDAVEPNWALIYNVRENSWYDTPLPNSGRTAGVLPTVFRKPLMTGCDPIVNPTDTRITETGNTRITESGDTRVTEDSGEVTYKLWIHEEGTDEIDGQSVQPILSFFETSDVSLPAQKGDSHALQVLMVEPDFVQSGDMTMQITGRDNARSPEVTSVEHVIPPLPVTSEYEVVYPKDQRRELRFRFQSNTLGGDYQMGSVLGHVRPGDGRTLG